MATEESKRSCLRDRSKLERPREQRLVQEDGEASSAGHGHLGTQASEEKKTMSSEDIKRIKLEFYSDRDAYQKALDVAISKINDTICMLEAMERNSDNRRPLGAINSSPSSKRTKGGGVELKTKTLFEQQVSLISVEKDIESMSVKPNNFKLCMPKVRSRRVGQMYRDKAPCPACQEELSCRNSFRNDVEWSPAFYRHCFLECPKYLAQGLVAHCHLCKLQFVNSIEFESHFHFTHVVPCKNSYSIEKLRFVGFTQRELTRHVFSCRGCGEQFKSNRIFDPVVPEEAYTNHCLRCEDYKSLRIRRKCSVADCHAEFSTPFKMIHHEAKSGHRQQ